MEKYNQCSVLLLSEEVSFLSELNNLVGVETSLSSPVRNKLELRSFLNPFLKSGLSKVSPLPQILSAIIPPLRSNFMS